MIPKTFDAAFRAECVALMLASSMALGSDWLGRDVPQRRVLFIPAEYDTDELHRRIADIARPEGFAIADLVLDTLAYLFPGNDTDDLPDGKCPDK